MGIPLVVAELTGMYRRDLRRFNYGSKGKVCPGRPSSAEFPQGHDATNTIGFVPADDAERVHGDNWPHDDEHWPSKCDHCDYVFEDEDEWQRNDNPMYRRPDGVEFALWGSLKDVPAGTVMRLPWADEYMSARHPQRTPSWRVQLPDGGEWVTSQQASGGGFWTIEGEPPMMTVTPSIWHNQSSGGWHGWIRNGELVDA